MKHHIKIVDINDKEATEITFLISEDLRNFVQHKLEESSQRNPGMCRKLETVATPKVIKK